MTTRIHAIYEKGVFRPDVAVPLADGSEVDLIVSEVPNSRTLAKALEEIARLPAEGPLDGFSGADHDKVLYGEPKAE